MKNKYPLSQINERVILFTCTSKTYVISDILTFSGLRLIIAEPGQPNDTAVHKFNRLFFC